MSQPSWSVALPAFGAVDRAVAALGTVASPYMHVVMDVEGLVELDLLDEAWTSMRHALLALRMTGDPLCGGSSWAIAVRSSPSAPILSLAEQAGWTGELPGPVETSLISGGPDLARDGPARLAVVDRGGWHRLVLTLNHVVFDGWSAAALMDELACCYSEMSSGSSQRTPPRSLRSLRLEDVVDEFVRPSTRFAVANQYARRWMMPKQSGHVRASSVSSVAGYAVVDVTDALASLAAMRARFGWRSTAVVLALLSRSWCAVVPALPGAVDGWQIASNLRRVLGIEGGLGNLSGTEPMRLTGLVRPLAAAVQEADANLAALESGWPGLGGGLAAIDASALPGGVFRASVIASARRAETLGYGRSLSNLGRWPSNLAHWGSVRTRRCILVPPFDDPRWSTFTVLSLGGRTHLTTRTHRIGLSVNDVHAMGEQLHHDAASAVRSLSVV